MSRLWRFCKRHWILSSFFVLILGLVVRSFFVQVTDPYLLPTGENGKFVAYSSWAQYEESMRAQLFKARTKAQLDTSDSVMNYVTPYEIRPAKSIAGSKGPYRTGILLVHGFNSAPGGFQDMLPVYETAGFLIRAVTLPGHGSCPGDLLNIDAEDYIQCVRWAVDTFRDEVDELYLVGMSTGGGISLILAAENDPFIKGVILESPLVAIGNKLAFLAPVLGWLDWLDPRLKWIEDKSQRVAQFYTALSSRAAGEIYRLSQLVQKAIETSISASICSITAADDDVVNPFELYKLLFSRSTPRDVHLIYSLVPLEVPKTESYIETVWGQTSDFGAEVVSYNHIALLVSPFNPLLGRSFRYCGHYKKDDPLYKQCLDPAVPIHYGSLSEANLEKYKPLAWLAYNPGFSKAVSLFGKFFVRNNSITAGQQVAIEQIAAAAAKGADMRLLLRETDWADLPKAMLAFQKNGDFGAVKRLDLWGPDGYERALKDISSLRSFSALEVLDLSYNREITDFSVLTKMPNLKELDLAATNFVNLDLLPDSIETLNVSATQIASLDALLRLKNLRVLRLYDTRVTDLNVLEKLSSLQTLYLSERQKLDSSSLSETVTVFTRQDQSTSEADVELQRLLALSGGFVNIPSVLNRLSQAFSLNDVSILAIRNASSIAGFEALSQLPNCKQLVLEVKTPNTESFDLGVLKAMKGLFRLRVVNIPVENKLELLPDLCHLALCRVGLTSLGDLALPKDLISLELKGNALSDVSSLPRLVPELVRLDLSENPIEDIAALAQLNLETLDLGGTLVKDQQQVAHINKETRISLDRTPLAQSGIQKIYLTEGLEKEIGQGTQVCLQQLLAAKIRAGSGISLSELGKELSEAGYLPTEVTVLQIPKLEKPLVFESGVFPNLVDIAITGVGYESVSIDLAAVRDLAKLKRLQVEGAKVVATQLPASLELLSVTLCDIENMRFLKSCPNLLSLDVGLNRISEASGLENCTKLQEFYSWYNPIEDLSICASLEDLRILNLGLNKKLQPDFLKNCRRLQHLVVSIDDPAKLKALDNLQSLEIYTSACKDFSWLSSPNIKYLFVYDTVPESLSPLGSFKELQALALISQRDGSDCAKPIPSLEPLAMLPNLAHLFLMNCGLRDLDSLKNLHALQDLDVSRTDVMNFGSLLAANKNLSITYEDTPLSFVEALIGADRQDRVFYLVIQNFEGQTQLLTCTVKNREIQLTSDEEIFMHLPTVKYIGLFSDEPLQVSARGILALEKLKKLVLSNVSIPAEDWETLSKRGVIVEAKR